MDMNPTNENAELKDEALLKEEASLREKLVGAIENQNYEAAEKFLKMLSLKPTTAQTRLVDAIESKNYIKARTIISQLEIENKISTTKQLLIDGIKGKKYDDAKNLIKQLVKENAESQKDSKEKIVILIRDIKDDAGNDLFQLLADAEPNDQKKANEILKNLLKDSHFQYTSEPIDRTLLDKAITKQNYLLAHYLIKKNIFFVEKDSPVLQRLMFDHNHPKSLEVLKELQKNYTNWNFIKLLVIFKEKFHKDLLIIKNSQRMDMMNTWQEIAMAYHPNLTLKEMREKFETLPTATPPKKSGSLSGVIPEKTSVDKVNIVGNPLPSYVAITQKTSLSTPEKKKSSNKEENSAVTKPNKKLNLTASTEIKPTAITVKPDEEKKSSDPKTLLIRPSSPVGKSRSAEAEQALKEEQPTTQPAL